MEDIIKKHHIEFQSSRSKRGDRDADNSTGTPEQNSGIKIQVKCKKSTSMKSKESMNSQTLGSNFRVIMYEETAT